MGVKSQGNTGEFWWNVRVRVSNVPAVCRVMQGIQGNVGSGYKLPGGFRGMPGGVRV